MSGSRLDGNGAVREYLRRLRLPQATQSLTKLSLGAKNRHLNRGYLLTQSLRDFRVAHPAVVAKNQGHSVVPRQAPQFFPQVLLLLLAQYL